MSVIASRADTASRSEEPSSMELIGLTLVACGSLAAAIQWAEPHAWFWDFEPGDTFSYLQIAAAAHAGDLGALHEVKHFWGTGIVAAALASVTGLSDLHGLLALCLASALLAVLLARRLWGGWVAGFFGVISGDWLQAATLGGSETVFVLLLLLTFVAARERRWALAALAASASSTIRPVGYIALVSLLAATISTRDRRGAAVAAVVGFLAVAASFVPVWLVRGDPLAHVRGYASDWRGGSPVGVPFGALARSLAVAPTAFTVARPLAWILAVLIGCAAALGRGELRPYARDRPTEAIFFALYVLFLFSYRSIPWSWIEFPRFAIPVLPFLLVALEPWLPKRRAVLWALAPASGLATAAWLIGVHVLASRIAWPS